jgi:hypothetical protein
VKTSADIFSLPIENPKHLEFRDDAWIGGPFVVGRYYLGKFLRTNEFLYDQAEYDAHLKHCLASDLPQADWIARSSYLHEFMIIWLKHQYRKTVEHTNFPIAMETKEERAIVRVMESPDISDEQIYREFRCTQNSSKRWTTYNLLRQEQNRLTVNWANK